MHIEDDNGVRSVAYKLVSIPPELFIGISGLLDGRHLIKLLMTGDKSLHALMGDRGGVLRFEMKTGPFFRSVPILLSKLTRLKNIKLKQASKDNRSELLPRVLPPSLEVIEFGGQIGLAAFFVDRVYPADMPIEDYCGSLVINSFERLHTINLADETSWTPYFLKSLPKSVTRLSIPPIPDYSPNNDPYVLPRVWPTNLLHLELSSRYLLSHETVFPPGLQTLRLPQLLLDVKLLSAMLPPTLTDVSISFSYRANFLMDEEVEAEKKFFANLKRLHILTMTLYSILQVLEDSPLETLLIDGSHSRLHPEELRFLPKTLKTLSASFHQKSDPSLYHSLPESLTSFTLIWSFEDPWEINDRRLESLPETLTYLNIPHCTVLQSNYVAFLPRQLIECSFLNHATIAPLGLKALPRSLKEVVFEKNNSHMSYQNTDLLSLPPTLTSLTIEMKETMLSDTGLANLPRTLKTFVHSKNTNFTNLGMKLLPHGLEHLHLPANDAIGDSGIKNLPPLLRTLILRGHDVMLTAKCFGLLPRSLLGLCLRHVGSVKDNSFASLPPNLETLILPGVTKLSDQTFRHLPRLLRRLVLTSVSTFTPVLLKKLPLSIEYMNIRSTSGFASFNRKKVPTNITLITKGRLFRSCVYSKSDLDNRMLTAWNEATEDPTEE